MEFAAIDYAPPVPGISASDLGDIALGDSLSDIADLQLPAAIDFMLMVVCDRGSIRLHTDADIRILTSSTLTILKPGHVLEGYEASDDFEGHYIVVSPKLLGDSVMSISDMFPSFFQFRHNPVIELTAEEMETQRLLRAMLRTKVYMSGHQYRDKVARLMLEAMFYETLGLFATHQDEVARPVAMTRSESIFYEFVKLVEAECVNERSVAYYAEQVCVTPRHLSSIVKAQSGRTAGEWIDSQVLTQAKRMLLATGMTIQEISQRLNFPNQSFFGRYFKHLTGMSPRAFRQQHEAE